MHRWIQQTHGEPVPAPQLLLIEAKQTCTAGEQKICGVEDH